LFVNLMRGIRVMLAGIDVMMNWLPGLLRGLMIRAECLMAGDGGLPSVGLMIG
jgi:hypothetical protein